jgi:hypothetical protein
MSDMADLAAKSYSAANDPNRNNKLRLTINAGVRFIVIVGNESCP